MLLPEPVPAQFVVNMVYHNPGEAPFVTKYNDPAWLKAQGYNGQCIKAFPQAAITYDRFDPTLLPEGSAERTWCQKQATSIDRQLDAAEAAGLAVYDFMDVLVVPKSLMAKYGGEMTTGRRFSILRPMAQRIMREQIAEVFDRFPRLDGLFIRFGETYLHDTPHHVGGSPVTTVEEHRVLIQLLREEVCVKRRKMLFYRTWSFGNNFHVNPDFYGRVTDAIEPHKNLVFAIKHSGGDFTRDVNFNRTLGVGKHRQLVEVSCNQAGLYGKCAFPYYIGQGVIEGWDNWGPARKGLLSLVGRPQFAGVWTWSHGDGWAGPYKTHEFWTDLNAYVIRQFGLRPGRPEKEIFDKYCREQLQLDAEQTARLRELLLLATSATYHGQESALFKSSSWWCRDEYLTAINLKAVVERHLEDKVLQEKAQAVADWKRVEHLARQLRLKKAADQEFVEVSSSYGRIKTAIIEQIWTMQLLAAQGKAGEASMAAAIRRYDDLWSEWRQLKADHACCPTLYRDDKAVHCGPPFNQVLAKYRQQVQSKTQKE